MATVQPPPVPAGAPALRPPMTRTLVSAGTATVLVCLALPLLAASGPQPPAPARVWVAGWVTLPYLAAGLVAWRRRPDSRFGPLMLVAGFVTFAGFLTWSSDDVLYTIGLASQFLPPVVLLHLFLSYPSGRLARTVDRAVVTAAYGLAALTIPDLVLGLDAARNVLGVLHAEPVADVLQKVQLLGVSGLLVSGTVLLVRRRRRDGRPLRLAAELLVEAFSLALVMIALLLLAGFFSWTAIQEPLRTATFVVVGAAPIVFLVGMLRARLGRTSVEGLLAELGARPRPLELQEAVARALRDPSATLVYWIPEYGSWADLEGQQVDPAAAPGRSVTPVVTSGRAVAALVHDTAVDDEPELLAAVTAVVAMTIENAALQVELRARVEELRGSRRRILEAERRQRRRLERDLHDGAQQRLVALSLQLGRMAQRVRDDPELFGRVEQAHHEVQASLSELRALSTGIHPATLSDHGLAVAVESMATRADVPVAIRGGVVGRLPEQVELTAWFVVSESLTNVMRHARASRAEIRMDHDGEALVVEVADDGVGGVTGEGGTGLRGLADRVEAIGGRLRVISPSDGGTTVRAVLPCGP